MLEKVIAETTEEMLDLQREEHYVLSKFLDALHKEEIAEAVEAKLESQENALGSSLNLLEDFDGAYEVNERKRDMSTFHFIKQQEKFEKDLKSMALADENAYLTKEFEMNKRLEELKQKEKDLKADLREIQQIVREQIRREWETQTK